jgi:hypothetical protein
MIALILPSTSHKLLVPGSGTIVRYLRACLFGISTAVVAAICWIVVTVVLPTVLPFVVSQFTDAGGGGGGYVTSDSVAVAALFGFVSGTAWALSRWR